MFTERIKDLPSYLSAISMSQVRVISYTANNDFDGDKFNNESHYDKNLKNVRRNLEPYSSDPKPEAPIDPEPLNYPAIVSQGNKKDFEVYWSHIQYRVYRSTIDMAVSCASGVSAPSSRLVLNDVSGYFRSGEMTALMGPSGAGKTSLMETLMGKRVTGLSGEIKCTTDRKIRMALIPQHEYLFEDLIVTESLLLASKMKNGMTLPLTYHKGRVADILSQLDLVRVKDQSIRSLSGSEKKRLSIGMDLISTPDLLFLDEPTTGLDSFTCKTIIEHLAQVAKTERMAVVMTIHQPSWTLFEHFSQVYMLSPITGTCVYQGLPDEVIPTLGELGIDCPANLTPSDFLTDVAFGNYGEEVVHQLAQIHLGQTKAIESERKLNPVYNSPPDLLDVIKMNPKDANFLQTMWLLLSRYIILIIRNPLILIMQYIPTVLLAFGLFLVFGSDVGKKGYGCPLTENHPLIADGRKFTPRILGKIYGKYAAENSRRPKELCPDFHGGHDSGHHVHPSNHSQQLQRGKDCPS